MLYFTRNFRYLKELSLSDNQITEKGLNAIADSDFNYLEVLDLSKCADTQASMTWEMR